MVYLSHKLTTMLDILESFYAVTIDLSEILKLLLQAKVLGPLEDLGSDIVSIAIEHDVFEQFALLRRVFHVDYA